MISFEVSVLLSLFIVCSLLTKQSFVSCGLDSYCFSILLHFSLVLPFFFWDAFTDVKVLFSYCSLPPLIIWWIKIPSEMIKGKACVHFFKAFFIFRRVLLTLCHELVKKEEHGWIQFFPYLWLCKHYLVYKWARSEISHAYTICSSGNVV